MVKQYDKVEILVAGLEHVMNGVASLAEGLEHLGIRTLFYSQETTGQATSYYDIFKIPTPSGWRQDMRVFAKLLRRCKPRHVEMYLHYSNNYHTIGHVLIASALGIPIVAVCTGGEILYWERHSYLRKLTVRFSLTRARLIVIKELYMRDQMAQFGIADVGKTLLSHNRVQILPNYHLDREGRKVLFLNSFKPWRRVDLIVKAAPQVLSEFPDARFFLVGARNPQEAASVEQLVEKIKLRERVSVLPWANNPRAWLESASVYVLPADLVFCNNSLLEAMERGTPPIVADVSGAERIVEHGKSGLRVEQTPEAFAGATRNLLRDEDLRRCLGIGARQKIEQDFDERQRSRLLLDAYKSKVW